jgi:nanoRNase/pAp phosphatase (c-di-AMP/oligoRNAs hydrolase)
MTDGDPGRTRRVCFYHAGCPDGMGAAWSVYSAWKGDGRFVARGHDDVARARDWKGADVVFVDIAPQLEEARALAESARTLTVLDHHVTARARFEADPELQRDLAARGHALVFDMQRSGAMMAWDHFHAGDPPPDLIRYVQDQDLWHWALPDSSEVNAAIASYPYTLEAWSRLAAKSAAELADEGRPILRSNRMEVERVLKNAAPIVVDGRKVEAVNSTVHRAQVGHELAERARFDQPWGCVYRIQGSKVHATLYSIGDFRVSEIAARLGGGGHPNAAGFTVTVAEWVERFMT